MYCREQKERERLQKLEQERERKQKEEEERRKKEEMKRKKVEQERIEKEKAEKAAKIKVNKPIIFLFFTLDFLKSLAQDVVAKSIRASGSCIKSATICVLYMLILEREKNPQSAGELICYHSYSHATQYIRHITVVFSVLRALQHASRLRYPSSLHGKKL